MNVQNCWCLEASSINQEPCRRESIQVFSWCSATLVTVAGVTTQLCWSSPARSLGMDSWRLFCVWLEREAQETMWYIWVLFVFISAKQKQDLECSTMQQLGVGCFCFSWECIWYILTSPFQTLSFLWIYEFLSYASEIHQAGTCQSLQVPWVVVGGRRQPSWGACSVDCTNCVRRQTRPHNRGD